MHDHQPVAKSLGFNSGTVAYPPADRVFRKTGDLAGKAVVYGASYMRQSLVYLLLAQTPGTIFSTCENVMWVAP